MSTSGRNEPEGSAALVLGSGPDGLDQVREILFGAHQRDFTRRLGRMDARVAAQAEELRSEVRRRLDVLEAHTRRELEALTASMAAQETAARDALANATRASRESAGTLEQRVSKLEDLVERVQRELREQLPAVVQTSDRAAARAPVWTDLHVSQTVIKSDFMEWLVVHIEEHITSGEGAA